MSVHWSRVRLHGLSFVIHLPSSFRRAIKIVHHLLVLNLVRVSFALVDIAPRLLSVSELGAVATESLRKILSRSFQGYLAALNRQHCVDNVIEGALVVFAMIIFASLWEAIALL